MVSDKVRRVFKHLTEKINNQNSQYIYDDAKAQYAIDFIQTFCKHSKGKWGGKPGAIVSSSVSPLGGEGANLALRQPMVFLNIYMMQQPEAYLGGVSQLLDEQGRLIKDDTRKFLAQFMERFAKWVENNKV